LKSVFAAEGAFCDSAATSVSAAFATFAAPDAGKIGQSSEYVFGRAAIAEVFAAVPLGAGPKWRPAAGTVASSNDLAFTFGPAWPRASGAADPPPTAGKYFTIWRRQADGTWRYVVD
jgi:ketosteroid isomerase-like protein